jgi:CRISPR/Cas system-associated endonuclease Cas1
LKYLNGKMRDMEFLLGWRREREDTEEQSRQSAAVLPSEEVLDKILRYEAALERQLYRAMIQLERLQRRRLGESVPPPLTMEVSERN